MTQILISILIVIGGCILVFYFLNRKIKQLKEEKRETSLDILTQNLQVITQRLDSLNQALGEVREIGRSIETLQDFLRSPKLRGGVGEHVLSSLLEQYFPKEAFSLQYKFRDGSTVDAILKTAQGLIPIDSKFPLENFRKLIQAKNEEERRQYLKNFIQDVKKHISEVSKKYILPEEGTLDFAVMYIPSDAIYYEVIRSEEDLDAYAWEKKVLLVSPNVFNYFLKIILLGLQGKKIEEASREILKFLLALDKDIKNFSEILNLVNTHITNAKNAMDRANIEYLKLASKIDQVKLLK